MHDNSSSRSASQPVSECERVSDSDTDRAMRSETSKTVMRDVPTRKYLYIVYLKNNFI